jgi:histidine phosphotransferase ChpT
VPSAGLDIRVAELLAAQLCHELSGPVAAIGNGAELLAEEGAQYLEETVRLIGDSAARVASRLQFYRFAYGFTRGATAVGPPPGELASGFFTGGRIACDWREPARALPLEQQKLACNLLLVAARALPRGGRLVVDVDDGRLQIAAAGEGARLSEELREALLLGAPLEALTARTAQAYFAGLLAAAEGLRLVIDDAEPGRLELRATAEGQA